MSEFTKTGISYLVRRRNSGVYYWQLKINGTCKRGSLKTTSQSSAKAKLSIQLDRVRSQSTTEGKRPVPRSLDELINEWHRRQEVRPDLQASTKEDYRKRVKYLLRTTPDAPIDTLTDKDLRRWWKDFAALGSPERANEGLRIMKSVFSIAIEERLCTFDPTLKLHRIPLPKKILELPTRETFSKIVQSIRCQGKRYSEETADLTQFLAFTGARVGEVSALQWSDIRTGDHGQYIIIRGGKTGTKNREQRVVPVIQALPPVLARRREFATSGPIFSIKSPTRALTSACKRLQIPHIKVHGLRHLFATTALESGVDPATLALWLGHKDKGELVMRKYSHIRQQHLFEQADAINFDT